MVWLPLRHMTNEKQKQRSGATIPKARRWLGFWQGFLGWSLMAAGSALAANSFNSVYISEFLADNQRTLQDNDRNYSGWIELYNSSSDVVNLSGWFLSDTPTNLAKWRFPEVGILPGGYLVVFA